MSGNCAHPLTVCEPLSAYNHSPRFRQLFEELTEVAIETPRLLGEPSQSDHQHFERLGLGSGRLCHGILGPYRWATESAQCVPRTTFALTQSGPMRITPKHMEGWSGGSVRAVLYSQGTSRNRGAATES